MSSGFVKHDLSTTDCVLIVRPGADAVALLADLLKIFQTPLMEAVVSSEPKVKH